MIFDFIYLEFDAKKNIYIYLKIINDKGKDNERWR